MEEWIRWKENSRTHIHISGLQNGLPSLLAQRFFSDSHKFTNEDKGVNIVFLGCKIVLLLQNVNLSEVFVRVSFMSW